jgi:hypothetical protein
MFLVAWGGTGPFVNVQGGAEPDTGNAAKSFETGILNQILRLRWRSKGSSGAIISIRKMSSRRQFCLDASLLSPRCGPPKSGPSLDF